jgi:glycosyltransferase involved in cell wall biosynthesis
MSRAAAREPYDVCSVVVSDLQYDARVWKQARALAASGRSVSLLGFTYEIERPRHRREDGIDVTELPFGSRRKVTRIGRVRSLLRLWAATVRTRARVYHCHNVHPAPAVWLASRLRRAPYVYDAHELYGDPDDPSSLRQRIAAAASLRVERFMVRRAAFVITTNEARAEVLRERHGIDGIVVLPNVPPRLEVLEPLDPGYPQGVRVLLYQGGIYPQYGIAEAIEAITLLAGVDLVILGFGREAELERLRGLAAEHGVADRVHFLGPRPFGELARTAAAASAGLVPIKPLNINLRLGDTNKIHDYLMGGLPVVASDLPEIRRIARRGDPPVGELFEGDSPASLAAAVERLLGDDELYRARRAEARRLALEEHNWEAVAPRLIRAYESVDGGRERDR